MANNRAIIFYWIIILIPSIIIGTATINLLSNEQERKNIAKEKALEAQAESIAQTIDLTIANLKDELQRSLFSIPDIDLKKNLILWRKNNPLIRNVFIWDRDMRLVFPIDSDRSPYEERMFIKRYEALFSKRVGFISASMKKEQTESTYKRSAIKGKKELVQLARQEVVQSSSFSLDEIKSKETKQHGWIPWFMENSLYILGWVSKTNKEKIYGIELEMVTLLSRIITDFPQNRDKNSAFVLVDGQNRIIHQSGSFKIDNLNSPAALIMLSNSLPHWKIEVYLNKGGSANKNTFFILSSLLVLIFLISIVSGGLLLLRQANKNRREAMEKTSFVASVSHELKTPLTSIRMYAELLSMGKIKDENKTKRYLDVILSESERLTRLVNNVLDFSRLEQGKKRYNQTLFNLKDFISNLVLINKMRMESEGIDLNLKLIGENFSVNTDRDGIEQVFLNLMDNIIKYAKEGKRAEIILKEDRGCFILKFIDFGPGIPEKHRQLIFEKFHRVDNSLTADKPGSGLGLSITRRILRDLGGDLVFEPGDKKGSCFIAIIKKEEKNE